VPSQSIQPATQTREKRKQDKNSFSPGSKAVHEIHGSRGDECGKSERGENKWRATKLRRKPRSQAKPSTGPSCLKGKKKSPFPNLREVDPPQEHEMKTKDVTNHCPGVTLRLEARGCGGTREKKRKDTIKQYGDVCGCQHSPLVKPWSWTQAPGYHMEKGERQNAKGRPASSE